MYSHTKYHERSLSSLVGHAKRPFSLHGVIFDEVSSFPGMRGVLRWIPEYDATGVVWNRQAEGVRRGREWFGIDKLRMDKFMMLVRTFVTHLCKHLGDNDWCEHTAYSLSPRPIGPCGGYMPSPLTGLVCAAGLRPLPSLDK
eukprot:1186696-Prorocentrum_minimum.AAC.3